MSVVTDQPITKAQEDRFGRREFAARIARVLASLEDKSSIVISVNAPWGEGKTSVLNMIEEELGRAGNVLVIKFNPWRFPDEERLLTNFFTTLAERIQVELKKVSEKIGEGFKDLVKCLGAFQIAGFSAAGAKDVAEGIFPKAGVEEVKKRINDALLNSPKKIVVFMDDIDRLDKRDIQAVFRLVKLTADFPNTAYVLAFDEDKVAAALAEQYGGQDAGRSFLEKIVQVPLPVPPASPQVLRKMVFDGVESALKLAAVDLTHDDAARFVAVFDKSFSRMLSSPRAVKRYVNMLNFALPILKGEANVLDLILIEGVRAFHPRVYDAVRSEPDVFLRDSLESMLSFNKKEGKERFDEMMGGVLAGLTKKESDGALFVLQVLFPRVREYGVSAADYYVTNDYEGWERRKRIAVSRYFRRYFNYGIPPGDVSDKEVESLIDSLAESEVDRVMQSVEALSDGGRNEVLIQKLRLYEGEIPADAAGKLALAVARRADLVRESAPDDNLLQLGSLAQAAILLRMLIARTEDPPERENLALEVVRAIDRLPFAYEYCQKVRKVRREEGSDEFVILVSDECELEINRIFAAKLAASAEVAPLEDSHPRLKHQFYTAWARHDPESLRAHVRRRLESRPEDSVRILNGILGVSEGVDSNFLTIPREAYDFIAKIIPPDEMMEFIRLTYPDLKSPSLPWAIQWFVHAYENPAAQEFQSPEEGEEEL